ncbi:hypothetical protein ACOSP7_002724 [Xanthoceras sorbifolium]
MIAHYCSVIIHVDDRVYLNYPKSPLELEHLPWRLAQVVAKSRRQLACGTGLLKMLSLRDLSSGEPSSEASHKNDWNRQKSPKRSNTCTLKEHIKNTR